MVGAAQLKGRGGDDRAHVAAGLGAHHLVLGGVVGEDKGAVGVLDDNRVAGVVVGGELQVHGHLLGVALGPVHGGAQGHDGAAVDVGAHVGVQARVGGGVGAGDDGAAVDDQPAVGVDAVALRAQACDDVQIAAVDGGDGDIVLVGVDAVVVGEDADVAAVHGQVQLGVEALVVGVDGQHAGAFLLRAHVHGHAGVEGAVILVLFLLALLVLVDAGDMAAGDGVDAAVGDDHVRARLGGVHLGGSGLHRPRIVALVHVAEEDRRGHGAGDIEVVQDQRHHGGGVGLRLVAQVYVDLALAQLARDAVGAGGGDVDHRVSGGLLGGVLLAVSALAVGQAAVVGIAILVVDDVMGEGHGAFAALHALAVEGDGLVGEHQEHLLRAFRQGGGEERQEQSRRQEQREKTGFHGCIFLSGGNDATIIIILCDGCVMKRRDWEEKITNVI